MLSYSVLAAKTIHVIQLALQDHQMAVRTILSFSDSIRIYAAPYARRESVYQTQMALMVVLGTPQYVAKRTEDSVSSPDNL